MRITVGIPIFNEQAVVPELLSRLRAVLDRLEGGPHEMVFVDDGSTDNTRKMLEDASRSDSRISGRPVEKLRSSGSHGGRLDYAPRCLRVMDGDLQNQPEFPRISPEHKAGAAVVLREKTRQKYGCSERVSYVLSRDRGPL